MKDPKHPLCPKYIILFQSLAIALVVYFLLLHLWDSTTLFIFQSRDLDRAKLLLAGNPIFFGPEAMGGGRIPGPFYYFLLAASLAFGGGWQGAWYLMIGLWAGTAGTVWGFLRSQFGLNVALFGVGLLLSSRPLVFELLQFWNPSFLIFFATLVIGFLYFSYFPSIHRGRLPWVICCLFLGLAIQLHYSALQLGLAAIIIQYFGPRFDVLRIGRRPWLGGAMVIFLLISPFLIWLVSHKNGYVFGQLLPIGGEGTPFSFDSFLQDASIRFSSGRLDFREAIGTFPPLTFVLGILFPAMIGIYNRMRGLPIGLSTHGLFPDQIAALHLFRRLLLVCVLCSLAPSLHIIFDFPFRVRYALILELSLVLLSAVFHLNFLRPTQLKFYYSFCAMGILLLNASHLAPLVAGDAWAPPLATVAMAVFLGLALAHGATGLGRFRGALVACTLGALLFATELYVEDVRAKGSKVLTFHDLDLIATNVQRNSGWTYEEARDRLFYVNVDSHLVPDYFFREPPTGKVSLRNYDGYFVISGIGAATDLGQFREWLLAQDIERSILRGLKSGELEVIDPIALGRIALLPYRVLSRKNLPPYFHNKGRPYETHNPLYRFFDSENGRTHASLVKDGALYFQWNNGPADCRGCRVGILLNLVRESKNEVRVALEIFGAPLSQTSGWTSPVWTEGWIKPYVQISCAGKIQRRKIAGVVGFPPKTPGVVQTSFLAPLKREFLFSCSDRITEIEIGQAQVIVLDNLRGRSLNPPPLAFLLPTP